MWSDFSWDKFITRYYATCCLILWDVSHVVIHKVDGQSHGSHRGSRGICVAVTGGNSKVSEVEAKRLTFL